MTSRLAFSGKITTGIFSRNDKSTAFLNHLGGVSVSFLAPAGRPVFLDASREILFCRDLKTPIHSQDFAVEYSGPCFHSDAVFDLATELDH